MELMHMYYMMSFHTTDFRDRIVFDLCITDFSIQSFQPELETDSYLYTSGLATPDDILFASTLDGKLVALDSSNGEVLWSLHEEPVVKSPYDSSKV